MGNTFKKGSVVVVNNKMQKGYRYLLSARAGVLEPGFCPAFTPREMLELGVFEGHYCTDCAKEYPASWFKRARMNPERPDPGLNCFKVKARSSLGEWRRKGWINPIDPRGWFEWYMRYYLGRRVPGYDETQIKRWRSFVRHRAQIEKHCARGDLECRKRQRQAILQWAYDPFF